MRRTRRGGCLASGLAAFFVAAPAAALSPVPQGPDFQVNTYTTLYELLNPAVAIDPTGGFVVAWESQGSPGNDTGPSFSIQAQRYASNGAPLGSQFQVNAYTPGSQVGSSVTMLPDGGFVVAWGSSGSFGTDTSSDSIQARRYASDGSAIGTQFQINTYTTGKQRRPATADLGNGVFVVVWESYGSFGNDNSSSSIQGQRYTGFGFPLGAQFQVNSYTTSAQDLPAVASQPNGDFMVVWQSLGSSGTDTDQGSIQAQRFASDGSPVGSQFQVNSYTTNGQYWLDVAPLANGDFVVVWESNGSPGTDTSGESIQAQRFASNGSPLGSQFQVNSYTTSGQYFPKVAAQGDGDFLVTWLNSGSDASNHLIISVQAQRYHSDGSALGNQFQVNTSASAEEAFPGIAANARGDSVLAWTTYEGPNSLNIRARRLDPIALGEQFQANSYTPSYQIQSSVASDDAGDFVVVWESYGSAGSDHSDLSIQGQRYASDGSAQGPQFQVNSYTTNSQMEPSVTSSASGAFVVVWDGPEIQAQRYASNGSPLGGEFQVNSYTTSYQNGPDVASEPDGGFVVVWTSNGSSGTDRSGYSIQGQRYASNGSAVGSQFQVNSLTGSDQKAPSVATDGLGDFVVVWSSVVTLSDWNIEAQRFASNGTPQGSEFQVNSYTPSFQKYPSVAAADDGDFVVVWQSNGSPGTDSAYASIQGQRFASNGTPLGSEFQANTYTTNFQTLPAVAEEPGGNFLVTWQSEGAFASADIGNMVEGQRYASDGTPVGGEFQVNTYKGFSQRAPAVSADATGHFVVTWESRNGGSAGNDTDNYSIQGQRFVPEPDATLALAAGGALLLALRRAREARLSATRRVSPSVGSSCRER